MEVFGGHGVYMDDGISSRACNGLPEGASIGYIDIVMLLFVVVFKANRHT